MNDIGLTDLIDIAERAVRNYADPKNRAQADQALAIWIYVDNLTSAEYRAVLDRFGPAPIQESATGAGG